MRSKISKKGQRFLKEGRFKDLLNAIHTKKEGKFKSDNKTYHYRVIGETKTRQD